MTKIRNLRLLCLGLILGIGLPLGAHAVVVFSEDFNTGVLDTNAWTTSVQTTQSGGKSSIELIGAGDYAFYTEGPPGSSGNDHTNWIYSNAYFPRGNNLRVTFKTWADPSKNTNWVGGNPIYSGIHGPWHKTFGALIYSNPEAMIRYWGAANAMNFAQDGDGWTNGGASQIVGQAFWDALTTSTSKTNAITIRVVLGDVRGAACRWSPNGVNFFTIQDTLDVSGSNSGAYLGWGTYGGAVFVDDIVVETDTIAGTNTPTPSPTPSPSPTPAPTPTVPPAATLPFVETWDSGSIDTNKWIVRQSGGATVGLTNLGGGDYALFNRGASSWAQNLYSNVAFTRGQNLRCVFRVWGDPSTPDANNNLFPNAASNNGPWHWTNSGPSHATLAAAQSEWQGQPLRFEQRTWDSGPKMSQAFRVAWAATNSKTNSLLIRVWLGNTNGAMIEWSTNHGATWTREDGTLPLQAEGGGVAATDNRENNPSAADTTLYLGWGTLASVVYYDDIIVENDLNRVPVEVSEFGTD